MRPLILMSCVMLLVQFAIAAEPLPRDDRNVYGQFDNGLKYIIRSNANPPGRVNFYLHVKTGALNESDTQNGLAHFTEHMAFNGSKNFEPGKLIPTLSNLGMTFGADTNAHTNLWETVYKLNMPNTKPETIGLALTIFSDYANGLNLSEAEIDSERKVIMEEWRTGLGAGERISKLARKAIYAGTRLEDHDVIGDVEQIKTFPHKEFQDYWNTWYRPENMTLIVVGDVKADDVLPAAKKALGEFKARSEARPQVKAGLKPNEKARAFIFTDAEQVGGDVELTAAHAGRPPVKSYEEFRADMVEDIATRMVNRRIADLVQSGKAPFRSASVSINPFLDEVTNASASGSGEPADWNKILDAVIAEITRAIDHGFTQSEFELVKKSSLAQSEQAVKTDDSRVSTMIITQISGAVGRDRPLMSAKQRQELVKRVFDSVTIDELHKVFVAAFKTENYDYVVTLPSNKEGATIPKSEDVLAAASAAWAKKTEAPSEKLVTGDILASQPVAGRVDSKETDADLKITTIKFENGVVMHHKFNDTQKNQVSISITMPGGQLEETADTRGLSDLASLILLRPATSRFTSPQLRDLMSGKTVRVRGSIGSDALSINVGGNPTEMAAGLELVYALITDGKLEQSSVDEFKKIQLQALQQMKISPRGQLRDAMAEVFYGGDLRFMPLTPELVNRLERSPAEAWFNRIVDSAAIEVAVVGDMQLDDAIDVVSRYIASLPKRTKGFDALDSLRKLNRKAGPFEKTVKFETVTDQAMVTAGFVSNDESDPVRRPLSLAAEIVSERMIKKLREAEQLVYSIQTSNRSGRTIPGTGMFSATSSTRPEVADQLADEIIAMFKDFAANGPTEDELAVAKKQTATELGTAMKEPRWWLGQLSEFTYRGHKLDELKQLPDVFQTFTADDLKKAVNQYLKDDALIRVVVIPQNKNAPATQPAGAH